MDNLFGRVDANGDVTWAKKIGGPANDYLVTSERDTGRFLVTGSTESFGAAGIDLLWAEFNSDWTKRYGWVLGGAKNEGGAFFETTDGGLLGMATIMPLPGDLSFDSDILIIKTAPATGAVQWSKILHSGTSDIHGFMVELADGFMLSATVADMMNPMDKKILFMKVNKDATGTVAWSKFYSLSITSGDAISGGALFIRTSDNERLPDLHEHAGHERAVHQGQQHRCRAVGKDLRQRRLHDDRDDPLGGCRPQLRRRRADDRHGPGR
jgi:hypothetical protein